jgi:hypothetical protein
MVPPHRSTRAQPELAVVPAQAVVRALLEVRALPVLQAAREARVRQGAQARRAPQTLATPADFGQVQFPQPSPADLRGLGRRLSAAFGNERRWPARRCAAENRPGPRGRVSAALAQSGAAEFCEASW